MSGDGTNFAAFACGMRRSGKSHLLNEIGKRFPRRLILDFIGEFASKIPGAHEADSVEQAVALLKQLKHKREWVAVCVVPPETAIELVNYIAPPGHKPERAFSYAVGGMTIECGEVDLIAPNNAGIDRGIMNLWARGRHYRVNPLTATQRPRNVHRIVTSQSDILAAFRQHEPRDIDYIGEIMRSDAPELLKHLRLRNYLRYFVNFGLLEVVDENGTARKIDAPR